MLNFLPPLIQHCLKNIKEIIQNNLTIFHTNENMKIIFPSNSLTKICRREKNLQEFFPLFPPKFNKSECSVSNCNKCGICKNYLICHNKSTCKVTGRVQRAIITHFSKYSYQILWKVMLTCKVSYGKRRSIRNVSFSLMQMI